MTTGEIIEQRLQKKLCVHCGYQPAVDWPYVCGDCQKKIADEQTARRARQDAAEGFPVSRN